MTKEVHHAIVQAKLTWHRHNVQRNDQLRTSIELPPEVIFLLFITIYLIILLLNIKERQNCENKILQNILILLYIQMRL